MALLRRFIDSVTGTPVDKQTQDFLDYAADMGSDRISRYSLFADYYDGDQKTRVSDRARRYLEASGIKFCENFCEPVVDTLAERLTLEGFFSTENDEDEDAVADTIGGWLQRNRLDAKQGVVHTTTLVKGDAFLIVDWNTEQAIPRFTFNKPELLKPEYSDSDPDCLEWLSKRWSTRTFHPRLNAARRLVVRLNVYYPDRIEKWFKLHSSEGEGGWQQWTDLDGESEEPWPVDWTDRSSQPLGIPVVHFRNKSLGEVYGRSRLKSVLPMQDELNKLVLDLNALADNHAYPQQWVKGVAGDNSVFKRVIGNIWQTPAKEAEFGQLDQAGLDGLAKAIEDVLSRMARRSRVPLHLLTGGDMPSGESLKAAEAGLVATAKDAQTAFGNAWEDAMRIGLKLASVFGDGPEPDANLVLRALWVNPESRNDKEDAEVALLKHELGVSKETLLRERGYNPEQEAERRATEAEAAAANMVTVMDRGGFGPNAMGGTA